LFFARSHSAKTKSIAAAPSTVAAAAKTTMADLPDDEEKALKARLVAEATVDVSITVSILIVWFAIDPIRSLFDLNSIRSFSVQVLTPSLTSGEAIELVNLQQSIHIQHHDPRCEPRSEFHRLTKEAVPIAFQDEVATIERRPSRLSCTRPQKYHPPRQVQHVPPQKPKKSANGPTSDEHSNSHSPPRL
jgi:hypothetical protein